MVKDMGRTGGGGRDRRVATRRPFAAGHVLVVSALVATAGLSLGCVSRGPRPHPSLVRLWQQYTELPNERAFAVAGDPGRPRWVAGLSAGHATVAEAEAGALRECGQRRRRQRMRAACVLYAVGDEIVWRGR